MRNGDTPPFLLSVAPDIQDTTDGNCRDCIHQSEILIDQIEGLKLLKIRREGRTHGHESISRCLSYIPAVIIPHRDHLKGTRVGIYPGQTLVHPVGDENFSIRSKTVIHPRIVEPTRDLDVSAG